MSTLAIQRGAIAPVLLLQSLIQTIVDDVTAEPHDRRFNALWIPFVIVMAGAAAMTVWCTVRGYSGWTFQLTWRGFQAKCV